MSWMQRLTGPSITPTGIFSSGALGAGRVDSASVLASYQGPFREQLLAVYERQGKVPPGTAEAARSGASGAEIGRHVSDMISSGAFVPANHSAGVRTLGMAATVDTVIDPRAAAAAESAVAATTASAQSVAAAARINPIYGGVMGQLLAQRGLLPDVVGEVHLAGAAASDVVAHVSGAAVSDAVAGVVEAITRADRIAHFDGELARLLKLVHV